MQVFLYRVAQPMVLLMMCAKTSAASVKAGEIILSTSHRTNFNIEGAVDENTKFSIMDDFYTAANLE